VSLPAGGLAYEAAIRVGDRVMLDVLVPPGAGACAAQRAAAAEVRAAMLAAGDVDVRVLGALATMQAAPLSQYLVALAHAARFWAEWTEALGGGFEGAQQLGAAAEAAQEEAGAAAAAVDEPWRLFRPTPAHDAALEGALGDMERQCAALQLAGC
jgi:hypothetical protein